MSDQELSGSADNPTTETESSQPTNQRAKGPSKIPGTAVFRSPYSQSKTSTPYYVISTTPNNASNLQQTNASDEDKRRIMHNEVERRRKEKINKWIVRLCAIVPNCNSGKQSKNCVLEKTVHFLQQLMKERDLPENVQALRAEVLSLTEKVESLSTENGMYLNLLKEAQALSGGAWTLNMSIQSNKPEIKSSSDDSSTTMTPTLDRVETPLSNVRIAPNIPSNIAITTSSQHPVFATVLHTANGQPILAPGGLTAQTIQPVLATGQSVMTPVQPTLISYPKIHPVPNQQVPPSRTSVNIPIIQKSGGSMVTAMPGSQVMHQGPMANGTAMMANGTAMMANGTAMMANETTVMANGHTVMANGQTFVANGTPLVAGVQPVMQMPGTQHVTSSSNSSHSIQALLSTAASGGTAGVTMGNKTFYTVPAYLQPLNSSQGGHANIYIPPVLVQGEQGHHVVIMTPGTNPYFAIPLNTMSSSHVMCEPTASFKSPIVWNQFPTNLMEQSSVSVKSGSIGQSVIGQQPVIQLPMVGTQPVAQMLGTQTVLNQQPVVQLLNQSIMNQGGQVLTQSGNQEHTIIQVPNSEVLMPQQQAQTQCFIPVVQGVQTQVQQSPVIATVAPVTSTNKVTDFSIGTFHGVDRSVRTEDLRSEDDDQFREYLRASDTSFSSDCFTPPYTSPNILLSSVARESLSPGIEEPENKPLNHSIASLTGMH